MFGGDHPVHVTPQATRVIPPSPKAKIILYSFGYATIMKTAYGSVIHDCLTRRQWYCQTCAISIAEGSASRVPPLCPLCLTQGRQRTVGVA